MKSFNKITKLTFGSIVITSLVFQNLAFAQATTERNIYLEGAPEEKKLTTVCPYTFTHDLYFGINDDDVVLLQKILNSDTRTLVAPSGIGSTGNETPKFGEATKEAVKKFQALFIEYIGIANGRFGPKTRTVMNAICNGDFYTKGTGTVYSGVSTPVTTINQNNSQNGNTTVDGTDKIGPSVYITSDITTIKVGDTFRVIINANEPILKFPPDAFIIDGGEVSDLRKLSPQSFSVLVTPREDAKEIFVQIEADKIEDLNGNRNPVASNEIKVYISKTETIVATTSIGTSTTLAGLENAITRLLNDSKEVEDTGKTGGKGKDSDEGKGDKTGRNNGGQNQGGGGFPGMGGMQNNGGGFANPGGFPGGNPGGNDPCQLQGGCSTPNPQPAPPYNPSCQGKTGADLEACKQQNQNNQENNQTLGGEKDIAGKIKKDYQCKGFEKKDKTVVRNENHIVFTIPINGKDEVILISKAIMSTKEGVTNPAGTTSGDNPTIGSSATSASNPTAAAGASSKDLSEKIELYKKAKPNACLVGKTIPTEQYKYCCKEVTKDQDTGNLKCEQHQEIMNKEIKDQLKKSGPNNISDDTAGGASSCSKSASTNPEDQNRTDRASQGTSGPQGANGYDNLVQKPSNPGSPDAGGYDNMITNPNNNIVDSSNITRSIGSTPDSPIIPNLKSKPVSPPYLVKPPVDPTGVGYIKCPYITSCPIGKKLLTGLDGCKACYVVQSPKPAITFTCPNGKKQSCYCKSGQKALCARDGGCSCYTPSTSWWPWTY